MALDKVPGHLNLFIGGLFTLRRREALAAANITHVLSILRLPLDQALFDGFVHKIVELDDVDDENLLEHLPATNRFIQHGLDAGGGVLVHCAMGKSRSATAVCAYLMQRHGLTPDDALARVREGRPLCEPNAGFMEQLRLYHAMGAPADVERAPAYQRWLYQREVELSRACGQAPDADKIRFEDEHAADGGAAAFELRCRKCRRSLATSQYLEAHQPGRAAAVAATATAAPPPCAHYFLDPLSWMRPELEQGKLDGRLECPRCATHVGKYAWQGLRCSCAAWVVPAITLARGRVDEVRSRAPAAAAAAAAAHGIRVPPSATPAATTPRRPGGAGHQNL